MNEVKWGDILPGHKFFLPGTGEVQIVHKGKITATVILPNGKLGNVSKGAVIEGVNRR